MTNDNPSYSRPNKPNDLGKLSKIRGKWFIGMRKNTHTLLIPKNVNCFDEFVYMQKLFDARNFLKQIYRVQFYNANKQVFATFDWASRCERI